jgi:hypothetical protein
MRHLYKIGVMRGEHGKWFGDIKRYDDRGVESYVARIDCNITLAGAFGSACASIEIDEAEQAKTDVETG